MKLKVLSLCGLSMFLILQPQSGNAKVQRQYRAEYIDPQGTKHEFEYTSRNEDDRELAIEIGKACFQSFKTRGISSEEEGLKIIDSCANPKRVK